MTMRTSLAALATLLAIVSTTAIARADDESKGADPSGEEAPVKRYPPTPVRYKLFAGGLVLTSGAWGMSYLFASTWPDAPGADQLKIPVVGPWMALGHSGCAESDPDCGFLAYFRGFLTLLDGVIQAGGLGIAGEGIFMTTEASPRRRKTEDPSVVVRPMPIVTSHTTGLGVVGAF